MKKKKIANPNLERAAIREAYSAGETWNDMRKTFKCTNSTIAKAVKGMPSRKFPTKKKKAPAKKEVGIVTKPYVPPKEVPKFLSIKFEEIISKLSMLYEEISDLEREHERIIETLDTSIKKLRAS